MKQKYSKQHYDRTFRPAQDLLDMLKPVRGLRQVGRMLGITRSAVFYIERRALLKVRQRMLELCPERK